MSGGGTISGITYAAGGKENQVVTRTGFFVKVPAAPSQDTTLIDYDAIADGYVRVKLTPQLHVVAEYLLAGNRATLDLGAITTGAFYWVEVGNYHHFDGGTPLYFQGLLQGPGSVTIGNLSVNLGNIDADYIVGTRLGLGVSFTSGYANFPNATGWELSKPLVESEASPAGYQGLRGMPTADLTSENGYATIVAYYPGRQPLGPAGVLVDTSGNRYNLAPGPQGLTVNLDGPYISPYAPVAPPAPTPAPPYGSESVSGGGTVSGITYAAGGKENQVATRTGFFVKVPAAPSQDTTLIDYDAIADGYVRVKLTPQLHVVAEYLLAGNRATLDLGAITTGAFYWVEVGNYHHFDGGTPLYFQGLLQGPGSVTIGNLSVNLGNIDADYIVGTRLGLGVSFTSGYANFPNVVGWELSKPLVEFEDSPSNYQGLRVMPTADVGSESGYATIVAYYPGRQLLGPAQVLVDTSGNGYNLAPGPQGLTVNLDGPYVSPYAPTALPTGPSTYEVGCGCNPIEGKTTDIVTHYPVNTATGDFFHTFTDLSVPGRGIPLEVTRTYNSIFDNRNGPFGYGWSANDTASAMTDPSGAITVTEDNGTSVTFDRTSSGYKAPSRVRATLVANDNGTLSFTDIHALTRLTFTSPTSTTAGQLVGMTDRNGYTTALAYTDGLLTKVTDPSGRSLRFGYNGTHIARISDPIGRMVEYTYSAAGDLTDVRDVMGNVTHFTYYPSTHLLSTMTDPRGGVVTNVYDGDGRVLSQTDPLSRTTTFGYEIAAGDPLSQTTTITDPGGNVTVEHYRDNELLVRVEGLRTPEQATWAYTYDPTTLGVTTETDPNRHTTTKTYDINGNLTSRTDALGRVTSYAYDALNDTTAITDPLGNVTSMTYDAHGNLLSTSRSLVATAATSANNGPIAMTSIRRSAVVAAACQGSAATPLCAAGVHGLAACAGRCNPTTGATGERSRPLGRDVVRTFSVPQGQSILGLRDDPSSRSARTPTSVPSRARPGLRKARGARGAPSCSTSRTHCATATPRRPIPPSVEYRSRDTVISVDDSAQGSGVDRFRYVGLWGHCKPCSDGARIGMYDRSSSVSRRAGDYYTLAFRGTGIALYSVHGPTHGIEEVTLDGRHRVLIDLYSARRTGDVLDHQYAHLADGVHVLTVRVTGRKNKKSGNVYVVVDRVAITLAGIIPPRHTPTPLAATATRVATRIPTSTPTTTPRSTATPAPTAMPPTTTASAQPAPAAPTPATPTATATPTPTPTSTATMVMPTATGTQTPTDTPTVTPVPPTTTSTATATMTPATSTPTAMPPSATATGTLEAGATLPAGTTVPATTGIPASPATTTSPAATVMAESTATSTFAPTAATTATPSAATASPTTTSTQTSVPSPTATTTPLPSIPCADAGPYTATVCLTYDPAHPGDVIARTDPDGHTTRYTYDATGDLASVSDPLGDTTTYGYDLIGRKTSMTRPLGNVAGGNPTNYTTTMTYNAFGKTTAMTDAEGNLTTFGYDANQNLITTTDPLGRQTIDGYDLDNERTSVTRPDGVILRTRYDDAGNVIITTDGLSQSTSFAYDALNRLISTTAPLGRTTVYTYDLAGNKTAMTDPLLQTTAYTYDEANQLVSVLRPNGTSLTTGYDPDGRVASQTDGRGSTTSYGYDSLGRTVTVTDGLGRVTAYGYDLAGNRTSLIDPMGRTTTFTYDAGNRLVAVAYSDGSPPTVQYSYDADGDRTTMRDGTGTTRYTYDTLDRATSIVDGSGQMVGYGYDGASELITLTYPGGKQVARAYDTLGRVTSVTDWLGHTTTFGYDGNGNVVSEAYPNASSAVLSYNAASDLTGITDTVNGTPRWTFGYERNDLGQVRGVSDGIDGSAHTYGYDKTHRLTSDSGPGGSQGWAYDAADNLAAITTTAGTQAFAYDHANELTALTTTGAATTNVAYAYNADGDRTAQGDGGGSAGSTFGWDQADRLIRATVGTTTTASYTYDGDGLRQSKAVTVTGGVTTTSETWETVVGMPQLLQDGNMRYVYGPLGPIEQIDGSDVPTYYYQDQLGSTRGLIDGSGTTVGTYSYDAYGQVTSHTGMAATPLQYAGQYTDVVTSLQYLRARYYDPATGQFLSRDPLVMITGLAYAYTGGDPLSIVDPGGLYRCVPFGNDLCDAIAQSFQNAMVNLQANLPHGVGGICAGLSGGAGLGGFVQACPIVISSENPLDVGFTLSFGGGHHTFSGYAEVGPLLSNAESIDQLGGGAFYGGGSAGEGPGYGVDASVSPQSCGVVTSVHPSVSVGVRALAPSVPVPFEYHIGASESVVVHYKDIPGFIWNGVVNLLRD